jgi:hypothetical protein
VTALRREHLRVALCACAVIACRTDSASNVAPVDGGSSNDGGGAPMQDASTSSGSTPPGPQHACDPLGGLPTSIDPAIAVGEDSSGNFFVVSGSFLMPSIFVSAGGALYEQVTDGAAITPMNYGWDFYDPHASFKDARQLLVHTANDVPTTMALGATSVKTYDGGLPPGAESLTIVPASTVASSSAFAIPLLVVSVADASDGSVVLLGRFDRTALDDYHVWFGKPPQLQQAEVSAVEGTELDTMMSVAFLVGGVSYVASYTVSPGAVEAQGVVGGGPGPGTLKTPSGVLALTSRTPVPTSLPSYSLSCY